MGNPDIAEWVQDVGPAELAAFMALAGARLVVLLGGGGEAAAVRRTGPLVTIAAAAQATGLSRRWFYDHANSPWMRRLGPRTYRVDPVALKTALEVHRG